MRVDHAHNHIPLSNAPTRREHCDAVEGHCFFVRRRLLDRLPLDGRFESMFAYLDLCFAATRTGAKIMVEPASRVAFLNPALVPLTRRKDLETLLETWDERRDSVQEVAFLEKWGLDPRCLILEGHKRWSAVNRLNILKALGVAGPLDRALCRLASSRLGSTPFRGWLQGRLVAKAYSRAPWSDSETVPG